MTSLFVTSCASILTSDVCLDYELIALTQQEVELLPEAKSIKIDQNDALYLDKCTNVDLLSW